jgi:hypothetical protein
MRSLLSKKLNLLFILFLCFLSLPGFGQEDDEKFLEDLENSKKKQLETAARLQRTHQAIKDDTFNAAEELKILGHGDINIASLMDEKVVKVLERMVKESELKNAPPEKVKALILEKASFPVQEFFTDHPKIFDTVADIVRDENALSGLIGILVRKDDLKLYGLIWILLMIMGWLIKKIFVGPDWHVKQKFIFAMLVSLTITFISFSTFYKLFKAELTPTASILYTHWKKS